MVNKYLSLLSDYHQAWIQVTQIIRALSFSIPVSNLASLIGGISAYFCDLPNLGGPGISGVDQLLGLGAIFHAAIGSEFDWVSFDPRGEAPFSFKNFGVP